MKLILSAPFLLLAASGALFGQASSQHLPATFHIQGTITSPWDIQASTGVLIARKNLTFHGRQPIVSADSGGNEDLVYIPRTEVTFRGPQMTQTLVVGNKGSYQADLPVGLYKMTVETPALGTAKLTPYSRLFRVNSAATVLRSYDLSNVNNNCDVVPSGTAEEGPELTKDACGGEDAFPLPGNDGTALELSIRYAFRTRVGKNYAYRRSGGQMLPNYRTPVFVAYDLFTLEADEVSYDLQKHTIVAKGDVVISGGSGNSKPTASLRFKIKDGQVTPLTV